MTDSNDAFKPAEMARLVETAGIAKAALPAPQMFVLALLAGAFIGFGAALWLQVMTGADLTYGPSRLLGGAAFSLGLILVIVGGAELFTGNALMVMAAVDGKITPAALLRNWAIVWPGNLIGAAGLAVAFWLTGLYHGPTGELAAKVAATKTHLPLLEAFVRAALCNALVCLAVWLTFAARDVTGKILAILWPIAGFVTLGLEHSVANMFFLPLGALTGGDLPLSAAILNLLVVSLGNIVGGAGGVALAYRFAFLRNA